MAGLARGLSNTFFDTPITLGVTGLSRAGKTVFITSLVKNLLDGVRMPMLEGMRLGRVEAAYLQPQPNDTIPRFAYETHLAGLTGKRPAWPEGTKTISQLRLSLRVQPRGMRGLISGAGQVHIDIVDYPGEWLLDLPLMSQSFAEFSTHAFSLIEEDGRKDAAVAFLKALPKDDAPFDEAVATELAALYRAYLNELRKLGYVALAPGRFMMPGDLEGSPALSFTPLPAYLLDTPWGKEFKRRFGAYQSKVVKPFFREHFTKIDRQVVLIDGLEALSSGPRALEDLRSSMADILTCFKPGKNHIFSWLTGGRVEKILFAATKADHLHHKQHSALVGLLNGLLTQAKARAEFSGAQTLSMAIASLRASTEDEVTHGGETLPVVKGRMAGAKSEKIIYAGELPDDGGGLVAEAADKADAFEDHEFGTDRLAPPILSKTNAGLPHIRLDQAAQFLFGDKL